MPLKSFFIVRMLRGFCKVTHRLDCRLPSTAPVLHRIVEATSEITGSQFYKSLFKAMFLSAFFYIFESGGNNRFSFW